ncbi:hypothetical protein IFM89_013787 [Coptis chinensis]|uniref:EamA domain-containing protein n=1 Tax=Coptis chinensis TaxID=261450 RepID=A0A835LMW8_9MAGN|nr:hypothetical protein IFM89_013787 [Coptis chinensis]
MFFVMVVIDFALAIVNLLLKKVLDEGMDHLVLITYRTSSAAILLAPIAYFWERLVIISFEPCKTNDAYIAFRKSRPNLTAGILCHLFLSALIGATLTQYFFLLGIHYTSATFACAFINIIPVITFVIALPFGLETLDIKSKTGRAKMLGTMVCVGGAMLLTLYKGIPLTNMSHSKAAASSTFHMNASNSHEKSHRWTTGSIALIAGALVWSSWFLVQAKISKRFPCQYSSTAIMNFFGALQTSLLSLIVHRDISIWNLKGKSEILTVLYAGMVGSGLCFVGMSWCVKKKGPLFTAAFSPLIQIIVAMFDFTILHEQLHLGSVLGSIFVIIGLYILLWGKSREAKACVAKPLEATIEEGDEDQRRRGPALVDIGELSVPVRILGSLLKRKAGADDDRAAKVARLESFQRVDLNDVDLNSLEKEKDSAAVVAAPPAGRGKEKGSSKVCKGWGPVFVMVVIDVLYAFVQLLLKKVLDEGMDHLVLIAYRTSSAAILLAPIAYIWER